MSEKIEDRITQTTGLDWQTEFENMKEDECKLFIESEDLKRPTAVKVGEEWVCLHCGDAWISQAAAIRCAAWDGHILEGREEWYEQMVKKYAEVTACLTQTNT